MARASAETPALPRVRNLTDLTVAVGDGHVYADEFVVIVRQEHELAVAVCHNPGALIHGRVRPTMFVCKDYRIVWQALENISSETGSVASLNATTIAAEMVLIDPGGFPGSSAQRLVEALLTTEPCTAGYVDKVLVRGKIARHEVQRFLETTKKLNDRVTVEGASEVYEEYVTAAAEIGRTPTGGGTIFAVQDRLETWDASEAAGRIVPSGIDTIDVVTGGGPGKGDLVVLGGGTNAGKSYFGEQLLDANGTLATPFLYLSIEDPDELMLCRMIARHTHPPQKPAWIRKPPTDPEELRAYSPEAIREARAKVDPHKCMFVDKKRKGRVSDVIDMIRRYRYEKGIVAAMVDYLQAVQPDHEAKGSPNIVQETAKKVSQLKEAAESLGIPLYLTSQLARDDYKNGAEPELTSCKYAGDIENETEILILIWKSADKLLRAKIAKAKWVETTTPRYIIRQQQVTGCFRRWEPDFAPAQAPPAAGNRGGRARGAGPRL